MKQAKAVHEHECPLCKKAWFSFGRQSHYSAVCKPCTRRQRRFDAAEQEHAEYRFLQQQKALCDAF